MLNKYKKQLVRISEWLAEPSKNTRKVENEVADLLDSLRVWVRSHGPYQSSVTIERFAWVRFALGRVITLQAYIGRGDYRHAFDDASVAISYLNRAVAITNNFGE